MEVAVKTNGAALPMLENSRSFPSERHIYPFRRVVGGIVVPSGSKPGFAIVIAEDRVEDSLLHALHKRVLAELEDHDVRRFIDCCLELSSIHKVDDWYGGFNDNAFVKILEDVNRAQSIQLKRPLYCLPPPLFYGPMCFKFYLDLIRAHLMPGKETLHFPVDSILPQVLGKLPMHAFQHQITDRPCIAALAFGLASLYICRRIECGVTTMSRSGVRCFRSRCHASGNNMPLASLTPISLVPS